MSGQLSRPALGILALPAFDTEQVAAGRRLCLYVRLVYGLASRVARTTVANVNETLLLVVVRYLCVFQNPFGEYESTKEGKL